MTKFTNWYKNKLTVGAFPYRQNPKFDATLYDIVINVSDEWYIDTEMQIKEAYVNTYWFPMNECKKDIGIGPLSSASGDISFSF